MTPFRYLPIALGIALSLSQIASSAEAKDPAPKKEDAGHKEKLERVQADFKAVSGALLLYRTNSGQFPTTEQGLTALIKRPEVGPFPEKWMQLMNKYPEDPWNFPYGYIVRDKDGTKQVFLVSNGPDRDSNKDDIEFEVKVPEKK